MKNRTHSSHNKSRLFVIAQSIVSTLLFASALPEANSQILPTSVTEEQRRRAAEDTAQQEQYRSNQTEIQERQRQLQTPNVELSESAKEAAEALHSLTLPVESPCFDIHQFMLSVPPQLSPAAQFSGASTLAFDPFRFAQDYLSQYDGACVGQKGVNLIVERLTNLILQKGYSTTRIGIPEQDLSTGLMTLTLVPGVIHAVRFKDPSLYGTWRNAFPTGADQLLNLRDLEQGLEQMKRVSSQDVDMQIIPGDVPGESDIVLDIKRSEPWTLMANFDNSGAKGTGKLQTGLSLGIDNLLGLSDILNIGISTDANRQGGQRGTGGHNIYYAVPMGYWNYAISASDYDYHQKIAGNNEDYISSGKSQNLEFKVSQLFQRNQTQKNSWQLKVGKRWSNAFIDDAEIGVQKRNTTYVELGWVHKHYFGDAQLDLTLANRWGSSLLGAQNNPDGRPSGEPTYMYSMQTIDATLQAPFKIANQPLTYIATFRGQNTRSPLFLTDQFTIGNRYTVRGFDGELTLAGERGFYLRNELDLPIGNSGQSAYTGFDFGKVYGPSVQYLLGDKLAGATVGVRGGYKGFTYDLFSGWSVYKPAQFKTATPSVGFSLTYQY